MAEQAYRQNLQGCQFMPLSIGSNTHNQEQSRGPGQAL